MELQLGGKIAIVTGASRGIGRAIVDELVAKGVHVALCARGKSLLEEVTTTIQQQYDVQALPIAADLSTLTGVQTLAWETVQHFGRVDILVNNAGAIRAGSLLSKPDADWHEDWSLKVSGYIRLMVRLAIDQGRSPQEVAVDWLRHNPLQRPGAPHEVAALAAFLASERAAYSNGTIIPVDGGAVRCI